MSHLVRKYATIRGAIERAEHGGDVVPFGHAAQIADMMHHARLAKRRMNDEDIPAMWIEVRAAARIEQSHGLGDGWTRALTTIAAVCSARELGLQLTTTNSATPAVADGREG